MKQEKKIRTAFFPYVFSKMEIKSQTTVVIVDILRATTTICTAFSYGVRSMIPVKTIAQAKKMKQEGYLVAGERIEETFDFADFGNGAFEFMTDKIIDKDIVHSTTNGTVAVSMAKDSGADEVIIGSFLNLNTVANHLIEAGNEVVIFCSGWKDSFCLEDTLFAGALIEKLLESDKFLIRDDSSNAALDLWLAKKDSLSGYKENFSHVHRLRKHDMGEVIDYSFQIDKTEVLPLLCKDRFIDMMKKAKTILSFAIVFIGFMAMVSCASVGTITGGEKDTTPPKVVETKPANKSTNFQEKSFSITFDEYIELSDVNSQLLISPFMKTKPEVKAHLRTVEVEFSDTLMPNTTYIFNFGKSIKDFNEGNKIENLTYVFSTGNLIDTFQITGHLIDAFSLEPMSEKFLMLYNLDRLDSLTNIHLQAPTYITYSNSTGGFVFNNIAKGNYGVVAVEDKYPFYSYDLIQKGIAFYDDEIKISNQNPVFNTDTLFFFKHPDTTSSKQDTTLLSQDTTLLIQDTNLLIQDTIIQDSLKTQLDTINDSTLVEQTMVEEKFGDFVFYLNDIPDTISQDSLQRQGYVLILENQTSQDTIVRAAQSQDTVHFHKLKPDSYKLKIVCDSNKNGAWDTGNYHKQQQPERVRYFAKPIAIKNNWTIEEYYSDL